MKRSILTTLKKIFFITLMLGLLACSFPFILRAAVVYTYRQAIYTPETVGVQPVGIIYGAGIRSDGQPSAMLRDRLDVAVQVYEAGKVEKLVVSGDNRFETYNEPAAMMAYLISQGVPPEAIQPDYGGRRTYDTCYRARHIFQIEEALLITQSSHLPRALWLCSRLGIEVVGVSADLRPYRQAEWQAIREVGATLQAGVDLLRREPAPVMGEVIPLLE